MKRFIIFLIRKRLGLKKYHCFRFVNQKTDALYWFTEDRILKLWHGRITPSNVSLNWILDDECELKKYNDGLTDLE